MDTQFILELAKYLLSPAIVGAVLWFGFNKTLKLGEIKKDFDDLKENVGELINRSDSMVTNITVIKTHLVEKAGVSAALFQTMSPITLTPSGKKLIQAVGFDDFVTANYEEIFTGFFEGRADTLLKLDDISEAVVEHLFTEGRLPSYANEAFQRGLSTDVLLRACALYLRDFMAKKLGITA